jgi:hypothetical protein
MNRTTLFAGVFAAGGAFLLAVTHPQPAAARCKDFQASHNGTDMFHPTGAEGAAVNKLMNQVEDWQKAHGIAKIRMTKVRTKCGDWFMKYGLRHKHCVANARACG